MYLKSIEVQGFKSFANKIHFEFHNGITCIVGPNGSGKSNVADAVRWVLGEQSAKQLRGANMQDVIFSGTELRKPQGFAYVAITLDNSDHCLQIDYDEVTVSRRVYRSGESEYKINQTPCRLRDIHELFYDTGIGKEGYSIIGQGQIDKILSNKPDERRELFDEAVGIVKFKHRKQITLKKLEEQRDNLTRVRDILLELEKQTGPLEKQAETAKIYLQLKEKLKTLEVQLFALEGRAAKARLDELEERMEITRRDLEESRAAGQALRQEYDEVVGHVNRLESEAEVLQKQGDSCKNQSTEAEKALSLLEEQGRADGEQSIKLRNALEEWQQQLQICAEQLQSFLEQKKCLQDNLEKDKIRENKQIETVDRLDRRIMELQKLREEGQVSLVNRLQQKSDVLAKEQRLAAAEENLENEKKRLQQQIRQHMLMQDQTRGALLQSKEELQNKQDEISSIRQQEEPRKRRKIQLQNELIRLDRQIAESLKAYHMLHSRADSLKGLEERYEGYQGSIRFVMEQGSSFGKIDGVVADLIQVEKKYELAIETALGASLQYIVTDSEKTAKGCIQALKEKRMGRATFLPLDGVRAGAPFSRKEALKEPGIVGLASDLVRMAPDYANIQSSLLGRILVAENMQQALAVARKYQYSLRIVTLEGENLSPGGSITGGAYKNTGSLLSRKREISELELLAGEKKAEQKKLQEEQEKLKQESREIREAEQAFQESVQALSLEENSLRMLYRQKEEQLEALTGQLEGLQRELEEAKRTGKELEESRQLLSLQIRQLENQNASQEEDADTYGKALVEAMDQRREAAAMLVEVQLELTKNEEKQAFAQESLDRLHAEQTEINRKMEGGHREQAAYEERCKMREIEQQLIRKHLDHFEMQMAEIEQKKLALHKEREELTQRQGHFFKQQEEISERVHALDKDYLRMEAQKEKTEQMLDAQTAYLWTEYEMMPSEAYEIWKNPEGDVPFLRKEIASLKGEIKGLGPVNVNAIEDYKEVAGRYIFMKQQFDDLEEAEQTLLQIVDELDEGMRRQFNEEFAKIQAEFDRVFKELFGGGHASLCLVEGEDVIDAGIQIISQPPGKKLQNMMQLSGGEKALTAIALLFAIQNLKPSPFCLLDEIEAALDDSNVTRFASYLHRLTAFTQFIVISHRRGTMVMADRLYGITMQEKGVSTLVSVNLIEQELEA